MAQFLKNQNGFTMVEVIISIAILTIAIVGVYSVFANTLILTNGMYLKLTASYLAEEGLEIMRNMRDENWINLDSGGSDPWSTGLTTPSARCLASRGGCEIDFTTNNDNGSRSYNNDFLLLGNDPNDPSYGFYNYSIGTPTEFTRKIFTVPIGATGDIIKVSSLVTWTYNGNQLQFQADEYLYNWK